MKNLWSKIRDLIRSITTNDEEYMNIKFNSDDELSLNKTIEISSTTIVVEAIFHGNNKYYPLVFLDKCLYKLQTRKEKQFKKI